MNKVGELLIRYQSRFINKRFNFGHVIIDSSAKDEQHLASDKFEEAVPASELYMAKFAHWVARPELYVESGGKTFDFYRGDSVRTPHVIEEKEDTSELDKDRIIKCPIQTKRNFLMAPVRSLQDLAGFGYTSKELFFNGSVASLLECSTITNMMGVDVIEDIDFFNLDDTIFSRVQAMIDRIPRHTSIFLHTDIGLKHDVTGLAICYYNGEVTDNEQYDKTSYPTFVFPLVIGISRKKGQSTSLDHIFQFIQRLSLDYQVTVSADSFASAGLFQSCERAGILHEEVSVDKTTEPYFMFKNVVNSGRAKMMYNGRLLRECSELRITTNGKNGTHVKIDHPDISTSFEFDYKDRTGDKPGTKDVADAVVGALWSCYKKYSQWLEEGAGGVNKQLDLITRMAKDSKSESQEILQGMLESMYDF